jgi:hypothetical protein
LSQDLEGLPGIHVTADNILITGAGDKLELVNRNNVEKLRAFLNRCREKNIKLNSDWFRLRRK